MDQEPQLPTEKPIDSIKESMGQFHQDKFIKKLLISACIIVVIATLLFFLTNKSRISHQSTDEIQTYISTSPSPSPIVRTERFPSVTPLSHPSNQPLSCLPKKGELNAKGAISVLVVPAYFDDVSAEFANHNQRIFIYQDAFSEINAYLTKIQERDLHKQLLHIDFHLSEPIRISESPWLFEKNAQKIRSVIQEKLPLVSLSSYQIVILRALTNTVTTTGGYNLGTTVWVNLPWSSDAPTPENAAFFQNPRALHVYRGIFTAHMLHEIFHSFGMSDNSYETEGARYNIFYQGSIYDGSQPFVDLGLGKDIGDVTDTLGIFQDIGLSIRKEIGWVDSDGNGIVDVEEFCN